MAQQINVGLIRSTRPSLAAGFESNLRFQEDFGLRKKQLEQQKGQFKQQVEAKRLEQKLTFMQAMIGRMDPEDASKEIAKMGDLIGYNWDVSADKVPAFNKKLKAMQTGFEAAGSSAQQQSEAYDSLADEFAGVPALEDKIKALDDEKQKLETQEQIASQAEAIAQQVWSSGYREGSKGPDEVASDIAGALTRGVSVNDILTSYGVQKPGAEVNGRQAPAENYVLGDGTVVLSYDRGRNFQMQGKTMPMPDDAVKVTSSTTLEQIQGQKARSEAASDLETGGKVPSGGKSAKLAALEGTGPYSALAAALDRVAGGLGADVVFGKKGLFPETTKNRQFLKVIRQIGKSALMNSSRGAIWEQERITELFPDPDTFFTNPRTEAQKIGILRDTLLVERRFNNQAIATTAISTKEIQKLQQSNMEIDKLLELLGKDSGQGEQTTILKMPDGTTQTFDASGKRIQ